MGYLATCENPFSLEDLAARVRRSSNFRFGWQFYQFSGIDTRSLAGVRLAFESIIATPDLHQFLRESSEPAYDEVFEVSPPHEHCQIATATEEFESLLARAAGDHLGAYSRELRDATAAEVREVRELFAQVGPYYSYQLLPGNVPGCSACRDRNNDLFSNWFYGVAWDWCLFAAWPGRNLFWMGCLTDTD